MPLYEYECRQCHDRFELLVRGRDRGECPSCKSQDIERLVSTFMVSSAEIRQRSIHAKRVEQRPAAREKEVAEFTEFKRSHQ